MDTQSDVTNLLVAYGRGDRQALDQLVPLVYDQLKVLAHARLRNERSGHTLNTTGLVNEAFLKLVNINRMEWQDRRHFFTLASRQMRRILVDWARRKNDAVKNPRNRVPLDEAMALTHEQAETFIDLEDALERMTKAHPRTGEVIELRYFGGLQNQEIAGLMDVSLSTIERELRFGRAWLTREWKRDFDLKE